MKTYDFAMNVNWEIKIVFFKEDLKKIKFDQLKKKSEAAAHVYTWLKMMVEYHEVNKNLKELQFRPSQLLK